MRGSLVTSTCILALALVPVTLRAQTPPAQQPAQTPPAQPPAAAAPQPEQAAAPKLGFTTPAGLLLVQVKPDQTAAFEELVTTLKGALAKSSNPIHQKQATSLRFYKASEAMGGNALYVVMVDPAVPTGEYAFLNLLANTMTADQQRAPETQTMFKKFADAFAGAMNKLSLTAIGGM